MDIRAPAIHLQDLDFAEIEVECRSTCGVPYIRRMKVGMPRIPAHVISSVFYLYASRDEAESGTSPRGTGFVVEYEGLLHENYPKGTFYGVTNYHVAVSSGCSVIRLNTLDGKSDVIELGPEEWEFLPGKYDVAVVRLSLKKEMHAFSSISTHMFVQQPREELKQYHEISVGEDVFMLGLFVDHDGSTTNTPSARFGNVSMLPDERAKIRQKATGYDGISYVIDMHSRTGFSGSPVFAYRTFGSDLVGSWVNGHDVQFEIKQPNIQQIGTTYKVRGQLRSIPMFRFLGIHWGQFSEMWQLRSDSSLVDQSHDNTHLINEGAYVKGMSGMSCAIPAWQIMEVLDMPKLQKQRKSDATSGATKIVSVPEPEADISLPANDANPTHREDFTRLVGAAARKPAQED